VSISKRGHVIDTIIYQNYCCHFFAVLISSLNLRRERLSSHILAVVCVEGLIAGLRSNALLVTSLLLPFFLPYSVIICKVMMLLHSFYNNGNKFSHYFIITLIRFFIFVFYSVFWIQFLKKSIIFAKKIYSIGSQSLYRFFALNKDPNISARSSLYWMIYVSFCSITLAQWLGRSKIPFSQNVLDFSVKNRLRWILMASGFEKFFPSREFWRERKRW